MFKNFSDLISFKLKIFRTFLLIVIAYIPFYRFFQALLENHTQLSSGAVFWLSHWYEPVIIILLFFYFIIWLFGKKKKLGIEIVLAIVLLLIGGLSVLLGSKSISRGLEGFRFVFLPIVIFITVYLAGFDKDRFKKLINVYLFSAVAIALWAIIEHALPSNYWSLWGILSPNASTWFGAHTVDGVRQSVSLVGGPNQLAAYLLPAFFIILCDYKSIFKGLRWFVIILFGLAIILTFSRSAFVGLAVSLFIFFILNKNKLTRWLGFGSFALIFVGLIFAYQFGSPTVRNMFTHGASQSGHVSALQESVNEIKSRTSTPSTFIFGAGLGSAGPSTIKYSDGIVSESWYLEIILELGFFGLFVWLLYFFFIIKKTIDSNKGLFFGFLSTAIASLFLHTFSDNPAGTFILFALLGVWSSLTPKDEIV
jgi:hypothetical protein